MEGAGKPFNGDIHLQDAFIRLRKKHNIKRVIETGTYHGDTTAWLADNFEAVKTVEYNAANFSIAKKKLAGCANVEMIHGDSSKDLAKMLHGFDSDLLIFLDAHWYANPVISELKQIATAEIKPVLVIHDFKNPNDSTMGYDEYPEQGIIYDFAWIRPHLELIYGVDGYEFWYNEKATGARRGCIFITKK